MFRILSVGVISTIFATLTLFTPVVSANGAPKGNNGTVKINNELAPDTIPNNHPHVSCKFSVEFYNYEQGNYNAEVSFSLQNPTSDGRTLTVNSGNLKPFIGSDSTNGGTDLDASEVYTLAFTGEPHAHQGYHVKLTVHAPESQGNDTKHKVFWVKPCAETSATGGSNSTGEVLGETTGKIDENDETPEFLPVTGSGFAPVLAVGAFTSGIAYTLHYRRSKRLV